MHIAANPLQCPQEPPFDGTVTVQPSPCHSQAIGGNVCPDSAAVLSPTLQTGDLNLKFPVGFHVFLSLKHILFITIIC